MLKSLILASMLAPFLATASVEVGKAAPDFSLLDAQGKSRSLAEFKGKTVVLEWNNPECPFVKKHYNASTNMQTQQKAANADGVVWLSINSGAPGKQGAMDGKAAIASIAALQAAPSAYLIDSDGKVGRSYDAKTTPHMYVIDAGGVLRYAGAIDSNASADAADIAGATQYVSQALAEIKAGKPVSTAVTKPYGCSVKY
jgi:peroxiredoxin